MRRDMAREIVLQSRLHMSAPRSGSEDPFRALQRALVRRRFQAVEATLRFELLALALVSAGFVFWQARVPLDGAVRSDGPLAFLVAIAVAWMFLALLAGALAGVRHAAQLRGGIEGPPWLALPIDPSRLERHFAWNARGRAWPLAIPAAGLLAAGVGLVPWWWLPAMAAALWLLLELGTRAGCWISARLAARRVSDRARLHPVLRLLATRGPSGPRGALPPARWTPGPSWRALVRKDLRLTSRLRSLRGLAFAPVAFSVLSVVAWFLPSEPALARFVAFGLALVAASALAQWLIALTGTDPFAVARSLPLGLREVWGARAAWAGFWAVALVAAHAVAMREMSPHASRLFMVWLGAGALCIGVLGANFGITLFPRADIARRLLGLALASAMTASIMIPLLGWVLLLAAVLHSARRLPRWSRLEAR
jgi:hypothetical protein